MSEPSFHDVVDPTKPGNPYRNSDICTVLVPCAFVRGPWHSPAARTLGRNSHNCKAYFSYGTFGGRPSIVVEQRLARICRIRMGSSQHGVVGAPGIRLFERTFVDIYYSRRAVRQYGYGSELYDSVS